MKRSIVSGAVRLPRTEASISLSRFMNEDGHVDEVLEGTVPVGEEKSKFRPVGASMSDPRLVQVLVIFDLSMKAFHAEKSFEVDFGVL